MLDLVKYTVNNKMKLMRKIIFLKGLKKYSIQN